MVTRPSLPATTSATSCSRTSSARSCRARTAGGPASSTSRPMDTTTRASGSTTLALERAPRTSPGRLTARARRPTSSSRVPWPSSALTSSPCPCTPASSLPTWGATLTPKLYSTSLIWASRPTSSSTRPWARAPPRTSWPASTPRWRRATGPTWKTAGWPRRRARRTPRTWRRRSGCGSFRTRWSARRSRCTRAHRS